MTYMVLYGFDFDARNIMYSVLVFAALSFSITMTPDDVNLSYPMPTPEGAELYPHPGGF